MSYIGEKKIKSHRETEERTPRGNSLIEVQFENGDVERYSSLMFEKIISEESCNLSELLDKRIFPVVEEVLGILRDWGVKLGELPYLSLKLNQSLDENAKQAHIELLSQWMPRPLSPDEVDLITIDRILKSKKRTLKDIL